MKTLKIKPCINKKNGQINFNLSKKSIGKKISEAIKNNPHLKIKLKFEGFD